MSSTSFRTARGRLTKLVLQTGATVLVFGLALSASARDASLSGSTVASSKTDTKVGGKPVSKSRRWFQVGVASWYGTQFQGRKTAAGERFDMNDMTCAHPTLPMGTWLLVTNLKNKRTIYVRVNDRGPVFDGRIVDLSFAAAQVLGMPGIGKVRLEAVRESDPELARALVAQLQMPSAFPSLGQ